MKKFAVLIVSFLMIFISATAIAANREGSFSFTPYVGGFVWDGSQDLKNSVVYGVRAGYNFTKNIGVEGFFSYSESEIQDKTHWEPWQNIFHYGIEGLYHFMPEGRFVPFVAAGVGGVKYNEGDHYREKYGQPEYGERFEADRFTFDYGAGLKLFITDNIALRADVRHFLPIGSRYENPHDIHNDFMASLGINFAYGGKKSKEELRPVPLVVKDDSDNDGIPDNFDKCACTPERTPVNEFGCPLPGSDADADSDGVPDHRDNCPGTPAGIAVNKDGCPLPPPVAVPAPQVSGQDTDRDGVPDDKDKCPGNPASVVVDKDGCPPDTDKDGVPDYLDKCQGSAAGFKVDQNGCTPDSDLDGVPNYLDKCPGTPSGTSVDKNGCPAVTEKKTISMRLKIEFDSNKSVVKKIYHNEIKVVGDFMKEHPDATATIVGHTDNTGSAKKNLALSQARADSIRQYLIDKFKIKGSRIRAIGYGDERPLASNATREGRQKNRRIVAVIEAIE